jgi:glycosyltransferase involved in cell wall biosynthesis
VRVLHIQKVKGIGGSERHLLTLLPALREVGIDARMCVLECGDGARFTALMRDRGVPTTAVPMDRNGDPRVLARLFRLLRRERPDLVHTHLVHADTLGLVAARGLGVRAVSSMHGTPAFYTREPYRSVGRATGRLARRRIAISRAVAAHISRLSLAPSGSVRVVYYGIDATQWTLDPGQRVKVRASLGVSDGTFAVGIASRLIPGKGHETVIDAVAATARLGHPVQLLVAGDGEHRPVLEERARSAPSGSVRFLGFLADVREFMHACDVVTFPTLPTLGEGFGLAALEAMAASRPVVASDVGSLPEVVDDGVTGIIVPAGSAEHLRAALVALATDTGQRAKMGAAGAARAVREFSIERMVRETTSVYREVVGDQAL